MKPFAPGLFRCLVLLAVVLLAEPRATGQTQTVPTAKKPSMGSGMIQWSVNIPP